MVQEVRKLRDLLHASLPGTGKMVDGAGMFMECVDPATQKTWMTISPVTLADFKAWEPETPYLKTGVGKATMDMAAFRHDPSSSDVPVQFQDIGGHRCIHVAKPAELGAPEHAGMPTRIMVIKGHTLGFEQGRRLKVMTLDDAHYVEVVGEKHLDHEIRAPSGGVFSEIDIVAPWIVELPYPTTTFFWITSKGPRSFQGPVQLPT